MPKLIILIGLPASGKSTWRHDYISKNPNTIVISNDDCIEHMGQLKNMSYGWAFHDNEIQDYCKNYRKTLMQNAINSNLDIIVDMTNMSISSRNRAKGNIPKIYKIEYIIFDVPRCIINHNNFERFLLTGKYISESVYESMENNFSWPNENEYDLLTVIRE